jgi:hypothetical protein
VRLCVERGSMPYSAVTQPWALPLRERRHFRLDGSRAKDARVAELCEHRSFGMAREVRRQPHLAHFVAPASARPHEKLRSKRDVFEQLTSSRELVGSSR